MNNKKILYTASVVKTHIMQFHIPYLKLLKDLGYTTFVAAKNDYVNKDDCNIPYCDNYIDIDFARNPFSFKNISAYKRLKKLINEENFDIIHCHTPAVSVLTRLASKKARKNGAKVYYTAHGFHFYKGGPLINWIYYPIEKYCSRFTDVLFTINNGDFELAKNKFHCKNVIYLPGIGIDYAKYSLPIDDVIISDLRLSLGVPRDSFVLVSVGELQKIKNHKLVIESLHKINNRNIYYLIAGQGRLKDEYISVINSYNLENNIKLLGYRNDINLLLKCCDVIVHPSTREGLGLAAIEGMASGLPLISSNIHGMNDYVQNNITGVCVNPKSVDEMVSAINKLYNDKEFRIKCGEYNKEAAKRFSIDESIKIVRRLYE